MLIRNATKDEIEIALFVVNERFEGNIKFKSLDYAGQTRQGGEKWSVLLDVVDSRKPGARRNPHSGRRIHIPCWHAYGYFIDALPEGATIITNPIYRNEKIVVHPGDEWVDTQRGNWYTGIWYASDECECTGEWW
jgi:hypothetical protein